MSYRNPQQTLDTSTAKLYGDISKSISKGMSSFDQAYKADQKAIKKNQDEIALMVKQAQDQKVLFDTTLNKAYEGGGTWFDQENKARLSEEANKVSLLMQKSVKTPEEMQRISNFMGAASTTTKDITQLGALLSNLENDLARGTKQGGVSESQDPEKLIRARGFAGLIPGAKIKVETDLSRPGGPVNVYKFTHPETQKEYSIDSKELRTIENTPGANMYDVIPDFTSVLSTGVDIAKNANIYDQESVKSTMVKDQFGKLVMTQFSKDASEKLFNQAINNNVIETVGAYGPQSYISAHNYWVKVAKNNPEQYPGQFQKMQPIDNKSNLKDRSQLTSLLKRATFIASGDLNKSVGKTLAGELPVNDLRQSLQNIDLFKKNLENAITSNNENSKNFFLNKKIGGKFIESVEFPKFDGDKYVSGFKDIIFTVREGVTADEKKFTKRNYDTTSPEQMRLLAQELYQFNIGKTSLPESDMEAFLALFPIGQPYSLSSVGVNQTGAPVTLPNSSETPEQRKERLKNEANNQE